MYNYNEVTPHANTLYILPLEPDFNEEFLSKLTQYLTAFYFGMKVKMQPPINIKKLKKINHRINDLTGEIQYNGTQILLHAKKLLPSNAYAMLCLTQFDIFNKEEWNYVFGLADLTGKTGVFSLARYHPNFYAEERAENLSLDYIADVILLRACKVYIYIYYIYR